MGQQHGRLTERFGSNYKYVCTPRDYIGRGRFGIVSKPWKIQRRGFVPKVQALFSDADSMGQSQKSVAVKVVEIEHAELRENPADYAALRKRLKKIIKLRHPHVVKYQQINITETERGITVELMMECLLDDTLCSLMRKLKRSHKTLNMKTLLRYGTELADGLAFLHRKHIVLGDLTSRTVFLERMGDGGERVKTGGLDDFPQLQARLAHYAVVPLSVTMRYTAPEMFLDTPALPEEKTDIWSVGCIVLDLLRCFTGNHERAFFNCETKDVHVLGKNTDIYCHYLISYGYVPFISDLVPASLAAVLRSCLRREIHARISAAELMMEFRSLGAFFSS
ncbi:uncharacterized protein LOC129597414 [Paramacrobiotus metropolitanus]|uniref:uncharacterized protein LOC129597414 n=1 Tax=Paramacrobiotus metropolitanus TaxID=2943436 RepID=UPI002445D2FA|nr:uncharacterized protein LOC129597414 [Paramacrobiotus metropolitanus]